MTSASVRACQPCRTAKTKCDLARPICSRCARLKHSCHGYTADIDFVFRNENVTAQRNSERARRKHSTTTPLALTLRPGRDPALQGPPYVDFSSQLVAVEHPWLQDQAYKNIPSAIDRPVRERAVDRFFFDWITIPADKGVAVGPLAQLPDLYLSSVETSAFKTIVEACAYAHSQYEREQGMPFGGKARAMYGQALMLMNRDVSRKNSAHDIRLMAALLLFDNFETLHLGRTEFLGPHMHGVKHILAEMTEAQFHSPLGYILWKIAYTRLLAKQITSRQAPTASQLRWSQYIGASRPDLYLIMSSVRLAALMSRARELLDDTTDLKVDIKLAKAQDLLLEIAEENATSSAWLKHSPRGWSSIQRDGHSATLPPTWVPPSKFGPLPIHQEVFEQIALAFSFNFHQTTGIMVCETSIMLCELIRSLSPDTESGRWTSSIAIETQTIIAISTAIMSTFPGFVHMAKLADGRKPGRSANRGDLSGRFFAMYTMPVFLRSTYVPEEHKFVARWLMDSLRADYALADAE